MNAPTSRTGVSIKGKGGPASSQELDVLILGGGVSGLTLAWELLQQRPRWNILVLEGEDKPGGTMRSDRVQGCLCEWGPNGFLTNVPHTWDLAQRLGLGRRLLPAEDSAGDRFLWVRGALRPVPIDPGNFLKSDLLSLPGRLRVLAEPFQRRAKEGTEDTVHTFAARRLGNEAASILVDAMVSGIFAGDSRQLSLASVFPKMAEMEREYGSLLRALIARRREAKRTGAMNAGGPAGPGGRLTTFDEGMEVLIQSLADALGSRVRCGVRVQAADRRDEGYLVTADAGGKQILLGARRLVCALPAHVAAGVLAPVSPGIARELKGIPYAGINVVTMIYRRDQVTHPLEGFGFLVPRDQGPRMLGAIWTRSIFPPHVPEDRVMLRVMVGGAREPELAMLPDGKTIDLVRVELEKILGAIHGAPLEVRTYRHGKGIPQYVLGHNARLEAISRELESHPGLSLIGNAYRGVGVNDCVRECADLAQRISSEDPVLAETGSGGSPGTGP